MPRRRVAPSPPRKPELNDRQKVLLDLVYSSAQANIAALPTTAKWADELRATAYSIIDALTSERDCRAWVDEPISSTDARVLTKWFEAETDWR